MIEVDGHPGWDQRLAAKQQGCLLVADSVAKKRAKEPNTLTLCVASSCQNWYSAAPSPIEQDWVSHWWLISNAGMGGRARFAYSS